MSELLELSGLSSGYGGPSIIRDINLSVSEGEVVGLLGPNGAGKTTTLLTISGLLRPTCGTIRFAGQEINRVSPHRIALMGVAHVPEDRSLFFSLTTRENLLLGARSLRANLDQVMFWLPELQKLMNRKSGLLSGGEQQMLALARALIRSPRLLLIDEMSLGLAPMVVERLFDLLNDIRRDTGLAILIVEQHVKMALSSCERVYVLNHGNCVFSDTSEMLRDDPALLEAAYLGVSSVT